MKKSWRFLVIVPLLLAFVAGPVLAASDAPPASPVAKAPQQNRVRNMEQVDVDSVKTVPSGEAVLADALVVRPFGLAACALGLVGSIFTIPWAATSHSQDIVGKSLIEAPFEDTFRRPLGEFDLEN